MQVLRGIHHALLKPGTGERPGAAVTVGNFDGVHRGHQAMLALLKNEAEHRGLISTALTFEPHPRDFFAARAGKPESAPTRIATLRDKLGELARCGIDRAVVLRFDERLASLSPQAFIDDVLLGALNARYVLVGDDFRFGARRAGDYALLDAAGDAAGFDVARMMSYEVHGLRVSSSAVREALVAGDMALAARLLGRPYSISGHVLHGAKLGRALGESRPGAGDGFRTLNLRFGHPRPAAGGIFVVRVHGLTDAGAPLEGVASLGVRPTLGEAGRVLLEVHCFDWPASLGPEGGYGKLARVELLHRLHEERRYDSLAELTQAIALDAAQARQVLERLHAAERRQTTRDRI